MVPAAVILGAASVLLLVGSVALAFVQAPDGTIYRARAELPSSLFTAEDSDEVAPVAGVITDEIAPADSPGPSPAPSQPTARAGKATDRPTQPPEPKVRFELTFSSEPVGNGKDARIRYTAIVTDRSEVSLDHLIFSSHVPQGTRWTSTGCEQGLGRLFYQVDGAEPHEVCVEPVPGTGHEVTFELPEEVPSGGRATLRFEVAISDPGRNVFVTHAHASAAGLTADSGDVRTEVK